MALDLFTGRKVWCGAALAAAIAMAPLAGLAQSPAPAKDVLVFTNGDQLSGVLERSVGGNVVFKSDMAGEITVPFAKVKELRTQGTFALLKHGDPVAVSRKAEPGKVVVTADAVTVSTSKGPEAAPVPTKDVAYLIDSATYEKNLRHDAPLWSGWNGTVNLGTSFTQATIHGGSVTGGVALVRQTPTLTFFPARNKTTVDFQENYGVLTTPAFIGGTAGDVQAKNSIMHADAERDEYLSKRVFALATMSFDHNYSQGMGLQQIYGGGFGWTPFSTGVHQLDLKADVHYEKQQLFDATQNQNLIGSSFSEAYRRTLPLKMTLTESASILPAWNNFNAYSAIGNVAVVAPVFKRMSMNVTASDSFINNPTPGYLKNSITFTTGLTYTLR